MARTATIDLARVLPDQDGCILVTTTGATYRCRTQRLGNYSVLDAPPGKKLIMFGSEDAHDDVRSVEPLPIRF